MRHRLATATILIGLTGVALAALPYRVFELDRFFVPKELVLHAAALLVGVTLVVRGRRVVTSPVDTLLAFFLIWSAASAVFATNHWLAQRALAVSVSSVVLFWGARQIAASGSHRPILVAAAFATVVAALTGLAQAYGFSSEYFSENRAPGGTFGNRNFVAHFAAIGLPALVYATVTARRAAGELLGSAGIGLVAAMLVLTRSRAAWLAVAASGAVLLIPLVASRRYWWKPPVPGRLVRTPVTAALGVAVAVWMPNQLDWRSDSPYLDSALNIVDYSSGSGRGRLAQYVTSMKQAADDPVLGAGPGNWPVRYVSYAPPGDRSLADDGMTANPWPSSDWVAFVSERGVVAAAALLGAFALLFLGAFRRWRDLSDGDAILARLVLAGTVTATAVVSMFDAVLLLAAPAFLAWTVMGATSARNPGADPPRRAWAAPVVVAALLFTLASVARSVGQTLAISRVGNGGMRAGWTAAASMDPGSYRIAMRAAQLEMARGRCRIAYHHAQRAVALFPEASAPMRILRRCS